MTIDRIAMLGDSRIFFNDYFAADYGRTWRPVRLNGRAALVKDVRSHWPRILPSDAPDGWRVESRGKYGRPEFRVVRPR